MPEPYVSEEADEEGRPEAFDQVPASGSLTGDQHSIPPPPSQIVPGSRREPTLPVRFAEPLTARDESTSRRRSVRHISRERPLERRGRERSSFLEERERQTSSPSPIRRSLSDEPKDRYEDARPHGDRERSPPRSPSPVRRRPYRSYEPSRAMDRDSRGDFFSEEDTAYMPSYFQSSRVPDETSRSRHYHEVDSEIRSRRAREDFAAEYLHRPRMHSFPRPLDTRAEPSYRPRPVPPRGASRYDSDDEWDMRYRGSRKPSLGGYDHFAQSNRYRVPPYEDDFQKRTAMAESSYLFPASSFYREEYSSPLRRRSNTFDEDDLDIKVRRRDRNSGPYFNTIRYPALRPNPFSPAPSRHIHPDGYDDDRSWAPPPPPIIRKKRGSYESDESDAEVFPSREQPRSRSRTPSPPRAAAPVIINNRIYNNRETEDPSYGSRKVHYAENASSKYARGQSGNHSYVPVSVRSRVPNHYTEDYGLDEVDPSEAELGVVPEAYQFTLSRHSKSLRGTDSILSSASDISDLSEKNEPPSQSPPRLRSESGTTYHVLQSHYVGDGVIGGSHAVQLSLTPDGPSPNSGGTASVFRWVHFEDQTMDFDNFEHNALHIPGLTDTETTAISKVLGRAKKGYDKPLQTATKGKTRFMVPAFLQDNLREEKRPSAPKARTISWICAPYFCLAKYATNSGLKPSSHPMRTLLQARFALVQKERDMKQAVRYLQDTPQEHCFHIAQVWFLILDNSLVISCARMSMQSIQGDYISIIPKPEIEPSLAGSNILVSTKSSLLWSLPLQQCQSWFGFVSHFCEYWPLQVNATYNDKPITASDWPRMLAIAKKTTVRLVVELRNCTSTKSEPAKGILLYEKDSAKEGESDSRSPEAGNVPSTEPSLRPTDHRRSTTSRNQSKDQPKEEFHVFTWINSRNQSRDAGSGISSVNVDYVVTGFESKGVDDDLAEIDNYLSTETSLSHRLTYNRCPSLATSDRSKLYSLMSDLKLDALSSEANTISRYQFLVGVLNAAELLFRFFLPPDSQAPTTSKYWGALLQLFKSMSPENPVRSRVSSNRHMQFDSTALELSNWLELINKATSPFKDYLTHVPLSDRADIQMPEELTTAWLHLVLAFTFSVEDMGLFENQMSICHDLVIRGVKKAILNVSQVDLSDYAVFQPFDFASLIAFQLSREQRGSAYDISDTYLEYLKTLQSDIEGNPLDRSHQDRIVCLKQEIEVISETLDAQQYVLRQAQRGYITSQGGTREDIDNSYDRHVERRTAGHNLHTDLAGVQSVIIQDNLALVENQIRGFREMREIASELGDWNIQKIDSNKDRQEAAIYAFTIVTIIFLPLGTVAGIMGMNTVDVRDMPYSQWVYWATALPLTVLVIALCLAWAGELNNFHEGFKNLWRHNPRNYLMVKESYEGIGRRKRHEEVEYNPQFLRSRTVYRNKESYV
ncbi:hypothetical protein VTL71DRAFT_2797 [Oculimacula yallundae]|uniref:Mg2+ transporter n=1 Tax=Oculimacula yallundae TaxID=86028 RepID=A0ABR4C9W7_9HELO